MLHYIERKPRVKNPGQAPTLILLHGYGSNEKDLFGLADAFDPKFHVISLRAPLSLGGGAWGWYMLHENAKGFSYDAKEAVDGLNQILAFLEGPLKTMDVDPKKVFLAGFSQGAILSLAVVLNRPSLVAGVMAWSGSILPEAVPMVPGSPGLQGKPVLMIHGTQDQVISITQGRQGSEILAKFPVLLTYEEFDMGHEINNESLELSQGWLMEKSL